MGHRDGQVNLTTRIQTCTPELLQKSRLENKPPPGRFVCIEVTDSGSGMDEETQRRMFDPFFSTKATGRGLGMSSVLGIVRAHKGAILVDSEVGRGSTFHIFFPVAEFTADLPAPPDTPPPRISVAATPRSNLVLIVDDEEMVRTVCEKMVHRFGFQTVTAVDGYDAIGIFRRHAGQIDGVLLDLTMPGMDGVATLKALREIQPDIKVLLASGYSEKDVLNRFDGQGVTGIIQKPYQMASLQCELEKFTALPAGNR
jgi:CheY-like chemotaxis protein